MAIFIKDENYKELSKIFLKDLQDYKEICKVYICTGPNQYELLFDGCADILCDGSEDGECSDCLVRWLSIYDELLLGTDGPTEEGISKLICPINECASGGLNTTCMDDEVCCTCGVDIFDAKYDPIVCQSLISPNCPCIKLDSAACNTLPDYINNTCEAYTWAALSGELGSETNCKSCIDSSKTQIGKCCKYGRKYTYIKKVTWNNNPEEESNCGIKRNCEAFNYLNNINSELSSYVIDYGYGLDADKLFPSEGGIAAPEDGPEILCPEKQDPSTNNLYCACFPFCCDAYCQGADCSLEARCQRLCNPLNNCQQFESLYQALYKESYGSHRCRVCAEVENDPCVCNKEIDPEGCDICVADPCGSGCLVNCDGNPDWCGSFCIGNEINWTCLYNSSGGILTVPEILTILRDLNCPCAPDFDTCNDICYDYFGTNDPG